MFLLNSRLGLVTATTQKSGREVLFLKWHPFSRSYGANLPSSFTWILSSALGFSPRVRVSVYGTGSLISNIEDFLGSMIRESLWARPSYSCLRINVPADLPTRTPYTLKPGQSKPGSPFTSASPHSSNNIKLVQEY